MTDYNGAVVSSQLVPLPAQVMSLPEYEDDVTHELVFRTLTPPMSVATYLVTRTDVTHSRVSTVNKLKKMTLGKNKLKLVIEHGSTELYYKDLETYIRTKGVDNKADIAECFPFDHYSSSLNLRAG